MCVVTRSRRETNLELCHYSRHSPILSLGSSYSQGQGLGFRIVSCRRVFGRGFGLTFGREDRDPKGRSVRISVSRPTLRIVVENDSPKSVDQINKYTNESFEDGSGMTYGP